MKTIKIKKDDTIKIIGQKDTFLIIENIDGDIFCPIKDGKVGIEK